ncbi:MAG: LysR family transcriptional regulator [Rhodocyclaceae bacterium]|nr:MAG: LysR family transcriptional regulator [Rhodocyclaceae bacterium]
MSSTPSDEPDWDLYRSFLHVLREGSLSGAARALGTTQPTIGRRLEALEAALGCTLFIRTPTGLQATDAARRLAAPAEAMAAQAGALRRAASAGQDDITGTVRLTASETIGGEVLPPILAELQAAHPAIRIELALTKRNEDLLQREADIAVRMVRPSQEALVARRLGTLVIGLYAHPRYAERRGLPTAIDELGGHALIGFDRDMGALRALQQSGLPLTPDEFAFRSDSEHAQHAALLAGLGIGACQAGIAARHPELLPVLPGQVRFELEMWLAMHEDLRNEPRIRQVFDFLADGLERYARG